ncbi:hypothetical protein D3C79_818820 [compost metagenome]
MLAGLAAGVGDRGVVDQAIQTTECGARFGDAGIDGFGVAQVEGHAGYLQALLAQFTGSLLHALGEDVGDHHPCAGLTDGLGKGIAQAAGATGDQHAPAFKHGFEWAHHWVLSMALGR